MEKEAYNGTNFIAFLLRKKNGRRDGRKRLRARMCTVTIPRKTSSPSGFSFSKVKQRGKKLPNT